MQKKEEVDLSHEKWKKKSKKNLYYGWERVIYTEKSFSVTWWRDEVYAATRSGFGLSVGGLLTETMMHIYRLSIEFF